MYQIRNLILTVLFSAFCTFSFSQEIVAGTFNLRYLNTTDSGNLWTQRLPVVTGLIRFHQFDIFGTQEGVRAQLNDIKKSLPEYDFYGVGRDDGKEAGEHSAIFFRKDRFTVLKNGDFWLSETPDQPSKGWDAVCCNRICSWVHVADKKTGKRFYFFSAHFDHQGKVARIESSKLILQRINALAGNEPVVFVGDLNGDQKSEWYLNIERSEAFDDTFRQTPNPYAFNGTFNAYGKNIASTEIIDHIFVTKQFIVKRWGILSDSYHGKFPSDHFPVLAEIELK
ncbi:MAG: endonuclease/exonuclease/phosphatase family protein [Chitinophagaceae bacterium]|nr:endonuclease/exonuclease/phosphatase family protein [Chitinophagaceae bacterium]